MSVIELTFDKGIFYFQAPWFGIRNNIIGVKDIFVMTFNLMNLAVSKSIYFFFIRN